MSRLDAQNLRASLVRLETEVDRALHGGLAMIAGIIAQRARGTTLFNDRTGLLRNSIRPGTVAGSLQRGYRVEALAGGMGVRYARFVHDGTRRMRPRPFMTQALESVVNDGVASRILEAAVSDAVDRAGFA